MIKEIEVKKKETVIKCDICETEDHHTSLPLAYPNGWKRFIIDNEEKDICHVCVNFAVKEYYKQEKIRTK